MDASRFARLPPELRNLVYQYTFTSRFAVALQHDAIQHPLTRTCRQIRRESLELYYNATRFNAYLKEGPIDPLLQWLRTVGCETLLMVQEIRLWDMHHNVLTMLSPDAGSSLLSSAKGEGFVRLVSSVCSPPEDNALNPEHRLALWSTLQEFGLGLRQLREQYRGSSIVHSTSTYIISIEADARNCGRLV